eukprot:2641778-Pyramimonas_sp.AAC.1
MPRITFGAKGPRGRSVGLYPAQCIDHWLKSWQAHPDLRKRTRYVWPKVFSDMKQRSPVDPARAVKGPISATILKLLRLQWEPTEEHTWSYISRSGSEEYWQFPDSARRLNWQQASKHYCGGGLEKGSSYGIVS